MPAFRRCLLAILHYIAYGCGLTSVSYLMVEWNLMETERRRPERAALMEWSLLGMDGESLAGPPGRHPEKLTPTLPLSEMERELFARLDRELRA
jgi:hypothetical protein